MSYFVQSPCGQEKTQKTVKAENGQKKLCIVLEVFSDVSVTFPDIEEFVEEKSEETCSREKCHYKR